MLNVFFFLLIFFLSFILNTSKLNLMCKFVECLLLSSTPIKAFSAPSLHVQWCIKRDISIYFFSNKGCKMNAM